MGLTLEPAGKNGLFEIKGVSKETRAEFSSRRGDILKAAKGGPQDAITLSRKDLNVVAGEVYKITGRNEHRSRLELSDGKKTTVFTPAKHGRGETMVETYRQETLGLNAGDRIRFTRGQRGPINNNDLATVTKITSQNIIVEMDDGKALTLPMTSKAVRHMDHGWAATAFAVQGKTVPNAIAIMPSRDTPLTTIESLYTAVSRHRDRFVIITDADSSGRRNTYYKLSMWSDDYGKEICTGWIYSSPKGRTMGTLARRRANEVDWTRARKALFEYF